MSKAIVRCVDLYRWQHPKLPKVGEFSVTARWRGRYLRATDDARRCVDQSIQIAGGIAMKYFMQKLLEKSEVYSEF